MDIDSFKSWDSWGAYLAQCSGEGLSVCDLVSVYPPIEDALAIPCTPDTTLFLLYLCDLYCLGGNYENAANLYTHVFLSGQARYSHQFECLDEAVAEFADACLADLVDAYAVAQTEAQRHLITQVIIKTLPRISLSVDDMRALANSL